MVSFTHITTKITIKNAEIPVESDGIFHQERVLGKKCPKWIAQAGV
jgi:hypothetical protein